MRILQETTEWASPVQNHIYVLNDSMTQMIAYVPQGSDRVHKFIKPMGFDRRGRTFVEIEDDVPEPQPDRWEVAGSKGKTYTVSREPGGGMDYHCTCPGYLYRNSCRHVAEFQMKHCYDVR